jgi:hypothetical protein
MHAINTFVDSCATHLCFILPPSLYSSPSPPSFSPYRHYPFQRLCKPDLSDLPTASSSPFQTKVKSPFYQPFDAKSLHGEIELGDLFEYTNDLSFLLGLACKSSLFRHYSVTYLTRYGSIPSFPSLLAYRSPILSPSSMRTIYPSPLAML